ncbi:MAG: fluoride efflux transporter CrcB [Gammaproteobacteria bacterium]|nr:fluoride efflux transporter CrcB [Gammaproteobacteria bacterium]NNF62554.1 fluoride efflux transporter CrcB [Gammaproteobacteria bacterium]NNM20743.1 fluoride efflux transporter CrcB [Gammaproteobacteria bacterium]
MNVTLAVAAGGALGAVSRYWLYTGVHAVLGRGFPFGTLTVNVIGSLLMGFLYVWLFDRLNAGPLWRAFLLVGCLGGFTTFSAFSIETLNLMQQGAWLKTAANVITSVVVCIAMAWLGTIAARQLA